LSEFVPLKNLILGFIVKKSIIIFCTLIMMSGLLAGCMTKNFNVAEPVASSVVYEAEEKSECRLVMKDSRGASDAQFSLGTLDAQLNIPDEVAFLKRNLRLELVNRGVVVNQEEGTVHPLTIDIRKFRIRNHRSSGFHPYVTYMTFSADLYDGGQRHRVTGYFKNGKVPVWAFREVEEPCYNVPMSLVVKEVATKINGQVLGNTSPDSEVDRLTADLDTLTETEDLYVKVLELGYTNNLKAVPALVKMASHDDSMIRACAVSSLGMLQAKDQTDFLIGFYRNHDGTEKYMALKAIGDMNTKQSIAFLKSVMDSKDSEEFDVMEVLSLYM